MRAIRHCDVLDEPADASIYSTNVVLNCTGGVGGALLAKYGTVVQTTLHHWLSARGKRFAAQGEVIDLVPEGLPYKHLIHTVPCDGMYDTTSEIVTSVLTRALSICASDPAVRRVALAALATGYGHLPFDDFIPLAATVMRSPELSGIPEITLCFQHSDRFGRAVELNQILHLGLTEISSSSAALDPR